MELIRTGDHSAGINLSSRHTIIDLGGTRLGMELTSDLVNRNESRVEAIFQIRSMAIRSMAYFYTCKCLLFLNMILFMAIVAIGRTCVMVYCCFSEHPWFPSNSEY